MTKHFVLLILLFALLIPPFQAEAAVDRTPPTLKDAKLNSAQFVSGKRIEIDFYVTDLESGPGSDMDIVLKHSSGKEILSMAPYESENKRYDFEFPSKGMLDGDWHIEYVRFTDKAGNGSTYETSNPIIQKLKFKVIGGVTDSTPPKLNSVNIVQTSAKPGDTITVQVGATDPSGVSGYVLLRHIATDDHILGEYMKYNSKTKLYEAQIQIPEKIKNGLYEVNSVELHDFEGNTVRHWGGALLRKSKLSITGGVSDFIPSLFQSVKLGQTTAFQGSSIFVEVAAKDASPIETVSISFAMSGREIISTAFSERLTHDPSTGKYRALVNIPPYIQDGTYFISQIDLTDELNNTTFVYPDPSIHSVKVLPFINGADSGFLLKGTSFDVLSGIKAYSDKEGDLTANVKVEGTVDPQTNGIYLLTYSVLSQNFKKLYSTEPYTYESYRWITVNDVEQPTDTLYFNDPVQIDIPDSVDVKLTSGSSTKPVIDEVTVSNEGSYQLNLQEVGSSSSVRLVAASSTRTVGNGLTPFSLTRLKSTKALNSSKIKFVIDKKKPAAPQVNRAVSESTTITGKTEANATVKLYLNNKYYRTVRANTSGVFSSAVPKQKPGTMLKAQTVDLAGNSGSVAEQKIIFAPSLSPVSKNSTSLSGKAQPYAVVKVYIKGKLYKTTKANSSGNYKVTMKKQSVGTEIKVVSISKGGTYPGVPIKVK